MMNAEYYCDEVIAINDKNENFGVSKAGKPVSCENLDCDDCIVYMPGGCNLGRIRWLMAEYEERKTITKQEYHFLKFVQIGWIARDEDGWLTWFEKQPELDNYNKWSTPPSGGNYICLSRSYDPSFSPVENNQLWKVEDLLKLVEVRE